MHPAYYIKIRIRNIRYNDKYFIKKIYFINFFLFYNAELLEICNQPGRKIIVYGFIDDVNILIYKNITEKNCTRLKKIHKKYII
jgi:hypothetical protein